MVIHCENEDWCSECMDECNEYKENMKCFFKELNMQKSATEEIHITPGIEPTPEEDLMLASLLEMQASINMYGELIIEKTQDEKLKRMEKKLNEMQEKINKHKLEIGLLTAEEERNDLMKQLQENINMIATEIPKEKWGPNQFTKGKKLEFSSSDGKVSILKSSRTVRKINTAKLLKINPLIIQKYAEDGKLEIKLKDAEQDMSKKDIDEVADKTTTYSYELYVKNSAP